MFGSRPGRRSGLALCLPDGRERVSQMNGASKTSPQLIQVWLAGGLFLAVGWDAVCPGLNSYATSPLARLLTMADESRWGLAFWFGFLLSLAFLAVSLVRAMLADDNKWKTVVARWTAAGVALMVVGVIGTWVVWNHVVVVAECEASDGDDQSARFFLVGFGQRATGGGCQFCEAPCKDAPPRPDAEFIKSCCGCKREYANGCYSAAGRTWARVALSVGYILMLAGWGCTGSWISVLFRKARRPTAETPP